MSNAMTQEELNEALLRAAEGGNARWVGKLLKQGARVDATERDGWQPLHFAAALNRREVAGLLIEKGAKVDAKSTSGWRPLHYAARQGYREMIALLLEHGADPEALNDKGETPRKVCNDLENRDFLEKAEQDPVLQEKRKLDDLSAIRVHVRQLGSLRQKVPTL